MVTPLQACCCSNVCLPGALFIHKGYVFATTHYYLLSCNILRSLNVLSDALSQDRCRDNVLQGQCAFRTMCFQDNVLSTHMAVPMKAQKA